MTFTYVVRPAVLALSGATQPDVAPTLLRAAFAYRKKAGRREYVRANLRKAPDGVLEAVKFPREGAGLISSLVDSDGLVELGEDVTRRRARADGAVLRLPGAGVSVSSHAAVFSRGRSGCVRGRLRARHWS